MPVTVEDFLEAALSFDDSFNEMTLRNRISRAYYSGYLLARDVQIASKVKPPSVNGGVHAKIIAFYTNGLSPNVDPVMQNEVAGLLQMSKALRTKADYKLNCQIPPSDGEVALKCAQRVHALLK